MKRVVRSPAKPSSVGHDRVVEAVKGKRHRYGLCVPDELWKRIVKTHWEEKVSINQLILDILSRELG